MNRIAQMAQAARVRDILSRLPKGDRKIAKCRAALADHDIKISDPSIYAHLNKLRSGKTKTTKRGRKARATHASNGQSVAPATRHASSEVFNTSELSATLRFVEEVGGTDRAKELLGTHETIATMYRSTVG